MKSGSVNDGHRSTITASLLQNCGQGKWIASPRTHEELTYDAYEIHATRTKFDYLHQKESINTFIKTACPAQRAIYSCQFRNDNHTHTKDLETRTFIPSNTQQCSPFNPFQFLQLLRNRRVLFIGDSITGQIWESLLCTLHPLEDSHTYVNFWTPPSCDTTRHCLSKPKKMNSGSKKHQESEPVHGYMKSGYIQFRTSNISLSYHVQVRYVKDAFVPLIKQYNLHSNDIVIINHGLFYANMTEYRGHLQAFHQEVKDFQQERPDDLPLIFFEHTTPQHFDYETGAYVKGKSDQTEECVPWRVVPDIEKKVIFSGHDHRNRIAHEVFGSPNLTAALINGDVTIKQSSSSSSPVVDILPIAFGLYNQYDAHVGNKDCTHWCNPSNAFKYVHMMIYNAFQLKLGQSSGILNVIKNPVDSDDDDITWKLHPSLKNGMAVQLPYSTDVYQIEKGRLKKLSKDSITDPKTIIQIDSKFVGPIPIV